MRYSSVVYVACAAMLSGCFGGDVAQVKESRMKGWPEFTVGQLLDKRKACSSVEWKNFTDTRDRKVVEYTCENQVAAAFLKAIHEDAIEDHRKTQQMILTQAKDRLVSAREDIGVALAELEKQQARVAELQSGNGDSEALRNDFSQIQRVREDNCSQTDPRQFRTGKVSEIAEQMARKCKEAVQLAERCPDSLQQSNRARWILCVSQSRLYSGTPRSAIAEAVDQVREMAEKVGRDQDRQLGTAQRQLAEAERRIQSANERMEKAHAEAEAAPGQEASGQQQASIERLNRIWANFKTVKEVSQWAIQDGQPVYLGSRVDMVFVDRTIDMPLEAQFVFAHAAKDASSVDDLLGFYRVQIRQMWNSYKPA